MTDRMIPTDYVIAERQYWLINHRMGSTYSDWLMVASELRLISAALHLLIAGYILRPFCTLQLRESRPNCDAINS